LVAVAGMIDVEALLAPISESSPSGANLRADQSAGSTYYQLKDARSAARSAERRADSEGGAADGLAPSWQTILTLAPKMLTQQSKDLEVAAWLTEALVRTDGFAGLQSGFALARGLVERYWDTFFSLEDEEGLATRLAPIAGLIGPEGTLIQPIRKILITADGLADGPFAAYHYGQARALAQLDGEARGRREAAGDINMDRFRAMVNASGGPFYIALIQDIEGAANELKALSAALDERAKGEAPSVSDLESEVTDILQAVRSESKELVERALAAAALAKGGNGATAANGAGAAAGAGIGGAGALRDREDALRILTQVAEFFRKHEPHSPISTSLDELVRRARLPFPALLAELLPDPASWRGALISAGIKPPAEGS
jgi:type VI secretion system protein ImpA